MWEGGPGTAPGMTRSEEVGGRARTGVRAALVSVAALAVAGLVGLGLGQPWLFPSLGPTLMVLAETPDQPAARPRNVLVGHAVGVAAGYLALLVTGSVDAPPVIETGIGPATVVAAALSVALTALVLQLLGTPHPPAGATTLIVSLGLLTSPLELATILLSVALVTLVGTALARFRRAR